MRNCTTVGRESSTFGEAPGRRCRKKPLVNFDARCFDAVRIGPSGTRPARIGRRCPRRVLCFQVKGIVARRKRTSTRPFAALHGYRGPVRTKSPSKRIFPEVVKRLTFSERRLERTLRAAADGLEIQFAGRHCVQTSEPSVVRTMM